MHLGTCPNGTRVQGTLPADRAICGRLPIRQRLYSTTTSSGNKKVVAPSSNCTSSILRPKLSTDRRMRGFSLNLLKPSWSRTGLSIRHSRPTAASRFVLSMFIVIPSTHRSSPPALFHDPSATVAMIAPTNETLALRLLFPSTASWTAKQFRILKILGPYLFENVLAARYASLDLRLESRQVEVSLIWDEEFRAAVPPNRQ